MKTIKITFEDLETNQAITTYIDQLENDEINLTYEFSENISENDDLGLMAILVDNFVSGLQEQEIIE